MNQACLLLVAGGTSMILAFGGVRTAVAESIPVGPVELEQAAVPPPPDDFGPSALSGEPTALGLGSVSPELALEPLDEDHDVWAEAFAESARLNIGARPAVPGVPVVVNAQVQAFLDRFTGSRREVVNLWLSRSGRYLGMIRGVLQDHGLPEDLAFVAMIESGYNPLAVSHAGAKGLWQFMAGTARGYGLRVDQWVDERLDPQKSTIAAAAYLRDLYRQFGSWSLAQAAYNAGDAAVARAIRRLGTSDFWTLARSALLRRETKEFVPQIHAATVIGRDPGRFGFEMRDHAPSDVETVSVPPSTNLKTLATAAGVSVDMLRALNPVLVRGVTPPGARYDLAVPAGTREGVVAALARPTPALAARRMGRPPATPNGVHVVRPRDTVSGIAKIYGVKVNDLLRWNNLARTDRIRPGDRLRVGELHASAGPAPAAAIR